jgi:hypothetical protein
MYAIWVIVPETPSAFNRRAMPAVTPQIRSLA